MVRGITGCTVDVIIKRLSKGTKVPEDAYIYLGYINDVDGVITERCEEKNGFHFDIYNISVIYPVIERRNKVYSNGGGEIYYIGNSYSYK